MFTKFFVLLVILLVVSLVIFFWCTYEPYEPYTIDVVQTFWKELGVKDINWKLKNHSTYNDAVSFLEVGVQDDRFFTGDVFFTLYNLGNRNELIFHHAENLSDDSWKEKLNNKQYVIL